MNKDNLAYFLLEEMTKLVEELKAENEGLKSVHKICVDQIHAKDREIKVYQAALKERVTFNEYATIYKEGRHQFNSYMRGSNESA